MNAVVAVVTPGRRYLGRIPVRNLWWLMLYASELYRVDGAAVDAGAAQADDDVANLVGRMLVDAVDARLRHQLSQQFTRQVRVLRRVRGRIDVPRTVRRSLLQRGAVACRFNALSVDNPRNRLVRLALETIRRVASAPTIQARASALAATLRAAGVALARPASGSLPANGPRFGDGTDRRMLAAARLALELAAPVEAAGAMPLPTPDSEIHHVRHLFERAVGGFYAAMLSRLGWRVRTGIRLDWQVNRAALSPWLSEVLPGMQTDVVLDLPDASRRIIVDTKFNAIVTKGFRRALTLRSGYLYQIYAYLQSQVRDGDPVAARAEGLLLHPSVGVDVDESMEVQGHRIRFATVDLAGTHAVIHAQLLRAIGACG